MPTLKHPDNFLFLLLDWFPRCNNRSMSAPKQKRAEVLIYRSPFHLRPPRVISHVPQKGQGHPFRRPKSLDQLSLYQPDRTPITSPFPSTGQQLADGCGLAKTFAVKINRHLNYRCASRSSPLLIFKNDLIKSQTLTCVWLQNVIIYQPLMIITVFRKGLTMPF